MARILVIDDDKMLNEMLNDLLTRKQHSVTSTYSISDGLAKAKAEEFDVVFLDVQLPDGNGLDIIPQLKESISKPEIIIMTGQGDANGAEIAVQFGAWCYLEKSSIAKELILPLTRVLQYREEKARTFSPKILNRYEIVGNSPLINKCLKLVADASCSDINVLITGETGTGKEVFASAIHQNSNRDARGNFVVVDCSSLPESLVESILFGHVKGAFTGADIPRKGLVHQANGGTLFLDEIGELPLSTQKSFLRVLQERRFRPVGSSAEEVSDFRLIAATNKNLEEMANAGTFRKDLLYRVRSMEIRLPPLRSRGNDILELAEYFINQLCLRYKKERKVFTSEFADALMAYRWPGNVRELYNALERVFTSAIDSPTYYTKNLPEEIQLEYIKSTLKSEKVVSSDTHDQPQSGTLASWKEYRNKNGYEYILLLFSHSQNNLKEACRISGLSKARIYQLIKKYNIQTSFS
jgi:two-component system NtrC family response regulator